jgi:hypothetical protein
MRSDLPRVVARELQKKIRLRKVFTRIGGHQMDFKAHVVALKERAKKLGGQVAIAIIELVEINDPMRCTPLSTLFFCPPPPFFEGRHTPHAGHDLRRQESVKRRGVHARGSALIFELLCHPLPLPLPPGNAAEASVSNEIGGHPTPEMRG